jgi:multisubunit Na+/H+ antiporter MnhB subunit
MLGALITILVIAIVAGLIYWVLDAIPVPQPLNRFAKIAIVVLAVVALIYVLLGAGGISIPR